ESPQDVYFDDLTVRHITGPLVEEKSYFPFGLVMGAISSRAVLKAKTVYAYNAGSEWEEQGIEYYDTYLRKYDAQIGRFASIDILADYYLNFTPYNYSANNPIYFNDPSGASLSFNNVDDVISYLWNETDHGGSWSALQNTIITFKDSFIGAYFTELQKIMNLFNYVDDGNGGGTLYYNGYEVKEIYGGYRDKGNHSILGIGIIFSQSYNNGGGNLNGEVLMGSNFIGISRHNEKSLIDYVQTGFDIAGLVPGIGELFDGLNAGIYALRGDYENAALSGAACIPFAGWGATGTKIARKTAKELKSGSYLVYKGVDANANVRYIGITSRDAVARFNEHLNSSSAKALLDYEVISGAVGLSKEQARIIEQTLINQYGLMKNGGQLLNKINSIAPKYWAIFGISK
ncbi:MAG TPA: RHS repeat-associated core domain-containing protein, partial [Chitinophagaceae bacterium]|nr:RHS repeat-associated core domain-containing protein [Chitinophagaceae bacterium]